MLKFPLGRAIPYARIAFWSLHFLFLVNAYRAFTQSITCDEAFTYQDLAGATPLAVFHNNDANNQPFYSYLCWLSTWLFGVSEFSLRLPSLAGGLLYFAAIRRLSGFLFGQGPYFLLAVWLLAANPYLLQFLSEARGCGLALAFFAWGFCFALDAAAAKSYDKAALRNAGYCFALSYASDLGFAIPLLAASMVLGMSLWARLQRSWALLDGFAGPGSITAFLLVVLPLANGGPGSLYAGSRNFLGMVLSLANPALYYRAELRLFPSLSDDYSRLVERFSEAALMLFGLALISASAWMWRRRERAWTLLAIASGTLLFTTGALVLRRKLAQAPYPEGRTETYFLFLIPIAALLLGKWLLGAEGTVERGLGRAWVTVLAALLCCELLQFETRFYYEGRFDADTRDFIRVVRAREAGRSREIKIGGNWLFEPSLNFYRLKEHYDWLAPVTRGEITGGFPYYLLRHEDAQTLERLHLQAIASGEVSGAVLAVPQE